MTGNTTSTGRGGRFNPHVKNFNPIDEISIQSNLWIIPEFKNMKWKVHIYSILSIYKIYTWLSVPYIFWNDGQYYLYGPWGSI